MAYYDGTKLLSMMDINGNKPEIYICTTNRTGGKTTYFNRLALNRFKKTGEKFCLLYRYSYELSNCCENFFKDINTLFFPNDTMFSKKKNEGVFYELYFNSTLCGYAIAINSAEQIKKISHFFSDVSLMIMDEFQSETEHYCPNEVKKLISVHQSIARGQGKQVRYVPIIMIGNPVSIINPYYTALGISTRLDSKTKFLKGDGFVLEQGFVESASKSQLDSGFNRAFANDSYIAYSSQNIYLNDNLTFIDKLSGSSRYVCTIRCNSKDFAIREYTNDGIIYCDNRPDLTYPVKLAVTTDDHQLNYIMLKRYSFIFNVLKEYFDKGCVRFRNLECKDAFLKAISYE